MAMYCQHTSACQNFISCVPVTAPPRLIAKGGGGGVKSGCFGALKLDRLGLNCKANKCSGAGTGDLGVLPTNEKSSRCGLSL